jgi:hypothetical protein
MFRCRAQPFAAQLPLLPLQVLADTMCDVVQKFSLFLQKRSFPRRRLWALVVDLDGADKSAPDGYR